MKEVTDKAQAYLKQFEKSREQYQKEVSSWNDEELKSHYQELEAYYGRSLRTETTLGRFKDDRYHYHWHRIDDNDSVKLQQRIALGYSIAHENDDVPDFKRSQDASPMGSSAIVRDVKNGEKAVLLRMPIDLYELNQKIKHKRNNDEALYDHNGNPLKISTNEQPTRTIRNIDAGLGKAAYEVDNNKL